MKKLVIVMFIISLMMTGCGLSQETQVNNENKAAIDNPTAGVSLEGIETEDYKGNKINHETFKNKKLTVLNLWGTWCGPCVEEMPDFEEVYKEYKDKDVQFIGLTIDSEDEEVKALKEKLGITYTLVKNNDKLKELVTSKYDYVPVTLFVDQEGKIIEQFIAGGTNADGLKKVIEDLINE